MSTTKMTVLEKRVKKFNDAQKKKLIAKREAMRNDTAFQEYWGKITWDSVAGRIIRGA